MIYKNLQKFLKQKITHRADFLIYLGNFILLDIDLEASNKNAFHRNISFFNVVLKVYICRRLQS